MTPDVILNTYQTWSAEPEKAMGRSSVVATSEGPAAAVTAGSFAWRTDLPSVLGGGGSAPSPTALLLSALAGCAVVFLRDTLAPLLGVTLRSVQATASCESDARGLLGLGGAVPDLQNIVLSIAIDSPDPQEKIDALFAVWRKRCPVYLALTHEQHVRVSMAVAQAA
ncbi:MAG TPA: OsmC family protein [Thermoanaerobaculia bacterium]